MLQKKSRPKKSKILTCITHCYYYFCCETDEIEKKIGTSKGPLSFINKSIYLPPEFIFRRR